MLSEDDILHSHTMHQRNDRGKNGALKNTAN